MIKETRELPAYLQFKKLNLLIKELKRVKGIFQLHVMFIFFVDIKRRKFRKRRYNYQLRRS